MLLKEDMRAVEGGGCNGEDEIDGDSSSKRRLILY